MNFIRRKPALLILCLLWVGAAGVFAENQVDPAALGEAISAKILSVPEFAFIEEKARAMGLKVWLFGGTATGFAHYVRWDLLRQGGDARYSPGRFDYQFGNIYRYTQDIDLVVDGNPEQARALQKLIEETFPYLLGQKTSWEVRPLHHAIDGKSPLLGDFDFSNQHTDSASTGLIELTTPTGGEARVRDLRDWVSRVPTFLRDAAAAKMRYYFSNTHEQTERFKAGLNPAFFSALRAAIKSSQYGLSLDPADIAQLREVIHAFQSSRDLAKPGAKAWLLKNGSKLIQNALNVQSAQKLVNEWDLRTALLPIGNPKEEDSMAWWLSKKPLPSFIVGQGDGQTAETLKLTIVAHETRSFAAFESITWSPTGEANVFTSRKEIAGETAAHGEGFYTRRGTIGAVGSGLTIRFQLKPHARAGTDFEVYDDYILINNRAAIEVIPSSLKLNPVEFYAMLNQIDRSDLGVARRLARNLIPQLRLATPEMRRAIVEQIEKHAAEGGKNLSNALWEQAVDLLQYLSLPPEDLLRTYRTLGAAQPGTVRLFTPGLMASPSPDDFLGLVKKLSATYSRPTLEALNTVLEKSLAHYFSLEPTLPQVKQLGEVLWRGAAMQSSPAIRQRLIEYALPRMENDRDFTELVAGGLDEEEPLFAHQDFRGIWRKKLADIAERYDAEFRKLPHSAVGPLLLERLKGPSGETKDFALKQLEQVTSPKLFLEYVKLARRSREPGKNDFLWRHVGIVLKHFTASHPSLAEVTELSRLAGSERFQSGVNELRRLVVEHGLPQVKTAQEFLNLTALPYAPSPDGRFRSLSFDREYELEFVPVLERTLETFRGLNPTAAQWGEFARSFPAARAVALGAPALLASVNADEYFSVLGPENFIDSPDTAMITQTLAHFFQLRPKPDFESVKRLLLNPHVVASPKLIGAVIEAADKAGVRAPRSEMKAFLRQAWAAAEPFQEYQRKAYGGGRSRIAGGEDVFGALAKATLLGVKRPDDYVQIADWISELQSGETEPAYHYRRRDFLFRTFNQFIQLGPDAPTAISVVKSDPWPSLGGSMAEQRLQLLRPIFPLATTPDDFLNIAGAESPTHSEDAVYFVREHLEWYFSKKPSLEQARRLCDFMLGLGPTKISTIQHALQLNPAPKDNLALVDSLSHARADLAESVNATWRMAALQLENHGATATERVRFLFAARGGMPKEIREEIFSRWQPFFAQDPEGFLTAVGERARDFLTFENQVVIMKLAMEVLPASEDYLRIARIVEVRPEFLLHMLTSNLREFLKRHPEPQHLAHLAHDSGFPMDRLRTTLGYLGDVSAQFIDECERTLGKLSP